MTEIVKERLIN